MPASQRERERYEELLQELRVMLPGVEVLFAFLLTAVFAQRFQDLDRQGRVLFAIALMMSAVTVLLLLAPASLHRLADIDRRTRIRIASRFQMAGSVTLGLGMCVALFVVLRFVFGSTAALLTASSLGVLWLTLWYLFPLRVRGRIGDASTTDSPDPGRRAGGDRIDIRPGRNTPEGNED